MGRHSDNFDADGEVVGDGVPHYVKQCRRPSCRPHFQLCQALGHHRREHFEGPWHAELWTDFDQGLFLGADIDLQQPSLVEGTVQQS